MTIGGPDRLRHVADLCGIIASGLEVTHVLEHVTKALEALRPGLFVTVRLVDQAVAVLTKHGHEVVEAGNGPEGLARCAEERFDVVISDLSMPTMSGWEFAAACRQRFPTLPLGLITGWGNRLDPALIERHRVRFVIAKPFDGNDILRQNAQVLT